MKISKLLPALFFSAAVPAFAAPVTLQSTWNMWIDATETYAPGSLEFTYDDATADSDALSYNGLYNNALLSATLTFDGRTYSFDGSQANSIELGVYPYSSTFFTLHTGMLSSSSESLQLYVTIQGLPGLTNDALTDFQNHSSQADLQASLLSLYKTGQPLLSGEQGSIDKQLTPVVTQGPGTPEVPLPGSFGFLASGLLGLVTMRKRARKTAIS